MNKQGKTTAIILVALVMGLLIYLGIAYGYIGNKTINEHGEPVDMGEDGQGVQLGFAELGPDGEIIPIEIPDWFKIAEGTGITGAIVKHSPAPSCGVASDCPGYTVDGNIDCYQSNCVLKNIDLFRITQISVQNPSASSDVNFKDVYISTASPTAISNSLPVGITNAKLLPLDSTISWGPGTWINIADEGWIDSTQTINIVVTGKNVVTGDEITSSDNIILEFGANPAGTFIVNIQTGVPA